MVKKRVCDMRWEVRDSTVEFLGHLVGVPVLLKEPDALLGGCCTTPLLREALQDTESYVRASAISALSKTLENSWRHGAAVSQEEVSRQQRKSYGAVIYFVRFFSVFFQLHKSWDDLTQTATILDRYR